ncbi:hypothetical protein [Saccharibacillus endophyticus]|uniref:Uncharacterized protein n=1 Tax=Saccharibacillus endophyticus TaxID=2060666 RepID=A0ABQ1ZV93_9BACL|nr:hypothetical protein [Saccharibacillus endophyticus]GGH79505.1 hypothetical protein GCM10007362_26400 [Saccharibacillus endophyticus]
MKLEAFEEHHAEALKRLRKEIEAPSEDRDVLKQLCVQVYVHARPEDALAIWTAKRLDFDAGVAIESELLIGAGLDETIEYVLEHEDLSEGSSASALLAHLKKSEPSWLTPREELLSFYRNDYGTNA